MWDTTQREVVEQIIKRGRVWIILSVLILVVFGYGAGQLTTTRSHEIYFSASDPQKLAFDELQNIYIKDENILIVISSSSGNVFNESDLTLIHHITEEAWRVPHSYRVDSITNYQHSYADVEGLVVNDLFDPAREYGDEDLKQLRQIATTDPILLNRIINHDGSVTAINLHVSLPELNTRQETRSVVDAVREIIEKYQISHEGVEIYLSGRIMMNNAFSEAALEDFRFLFPLSLLLMLLIVAVTFRSISAALIVFMVVFVAIIGGLGFAGFAKIPISPPTSTAPIIILVVAIANTIHILQSYYRNVTLGVSATEATTASLLKNLVPVSIASLTTALCFLSLLFSEVPPFKQLGVIVSIGVLVSFLASITLLPAVLSFAKPRAARKIFLLEKQIDSYSRFVLENRRLIMSAFLVLLPICIYGLSKNMMNDVFLHYFDQKIKFRSDSDFIVDNLTGLYTLEYSIKSKAAGGVSDPKFAEGVANFTEWLRYQSHVRHVASYTDVLKKLNRNFHNDQEDMYAIPTSRESIAQLILMYELSLPYGLDLSDQINIDKSATRITVAIDTISSAAVKEFDRNAREWISLHNEFISSDGATGTTMMFANIGQKNIGTMILSISTALVLVSLVLLFVYRSIWFGFISLLPNLLPAIIAFGVWGLTVGEIGLALSVVTSMTLGVIVDDTVHFMNSYRNGLKLKKGDTNAAITRAFQDVGPAMLLTSFILGSGFLLLTFSSFQVNSVMGLMTALIVLIALLVDLLLLPAILGVDCVGVKAGS